MPQQSVVQALNLFRSRWILGFVAAILLAIALWPSAASATQIEDVVCPASNNCVGVGIKDTDAGLVSQARRWNGAEWTAETIPAPSGATASELSGVSCASTSNCVTVGSYKDSGGVTKTLAVHWNGTSWSIVTTPLPSGATSSELNGISCYSTTSCVAVGSYISSTGVETAWGLKWNGTSWSTSAPSVPAGATASSLANISCWSSWSCRTVGKYKDSGGVTKALADLYNFTIWSNESTPTISGVAGHELSGIACLSSSFCTAVGSSVDSEGIRSTLAMKRESSWAISETPDSYDPKTQLLGISCVSTSQCTSAGETEDEEGSAHPYTLDWNGTEWTDQTLDLPRKGREAALTSVACSSGTGCIAAGFVSYSQFGWNMNLAYGGSGSDWSVTEDGGAPSRGWTLMGPSSLGAEFTDVSCIYAESKRSCFDVGSMTNEVGRQRLIIRSLKVGSNPTASEAPEPATASASDLRGISCVSNSFCVATGSYTEEDDVTKTLVLHWDGSAWAEVASPNPSGAVAATLEEVHCLTTSECYAAGSYVDSSGVEKGLVLKWNGTSWSTYGTYSPSGALATRFTGISCTSGCLVAGTYTDSAGITKTLSVEAKFGILFTKTTVNPSGSNSAELLGIACTASTNCIAVGRYVDESGVSQLLAEHWNGTAWSIKSTPNPSGATQNELTGVACASSSACYAVGASHYDGHLQAFDLKWNGTAWSEWTEPTGWDEEIDMKLLDISCTSYASWDCFAVGKSQFLDYPPRALARQWNGVEWVSENEGSLNSELRAVSCPEPGECIAVGQASDPITGSYGANPGGWVLDENSNWQPLPADDIAVSTYIGLDCLAIDECMAVGTKSVSGKNVPLAVWWDGEEWTDLEAINPGVTAGLSSVSCTSATSCVAVGSRTDSKGARFPIAQAWDGSAWKEGTVPAPGVNGELRDVSCASAGDCTAVGLYYETAAWNSPYFAQLVHWNGSTWTTPSIPGISGTSNTLTTVDCVESSFCLAAGSQELSGEKRVLGLVWNGTTWQINSVKGPANAAGAGQAWFALVDLTCISTTDCTAAGYAGSTPLLVGWNGTTWSFEQGHTPTEGAYLMSISCALDAESVGGCVSVGVFFVDGQREALTNAEDLLADSEEEEEVRTWQPDEVWTPTSGFSDTWCTSTSNCIAVGSFVNSDGEEEAQIKAGSGSSWSEAVAPAPAGSTGSTLSGVTCTSSSSCTAVGSYVDSSDVTKSLAMRWNGTSWLISSTPNPSGAQSTELSTVSCASESNCDAVGVYVDSEGKQKALALLWNGSTWTQKTVPTPSGETGTQLSSVACVSSTNCVAVGTSSNEAGISKTLVASWNGTSWSLVSSPNVSGATSHELGDVACTSASSCMAVGAYETAAAENKTMTLRWNGSSWWIIAAPDPGDGHLSAVSCPASSTCLAVGSYENGAETLPMAIGWDGSSWTQDSVEALAQESEADVFHADLTGVSCASTTHCVAAGSYSTQNDSTGSSDVDSEEYGSRELSFQFDGTDWARITTIAPTGSISGVSCPDEEICIGVGSANEPDDGANTINQAWKLFEGEWSPLGMPSPAANKLLTDVSCSAENACTAVGADSSSGKFIAERWNGSSWSAQTPPTPGSGSGHTLTSVSCSTSSACTAVGLSDTSKEATAMRAIRWNGSVWSESTVSAPGGATSSILYDVDCVEASNCVAVGTYLNGDGAELPLIRHWNGSSWSAGTVSAPSEAIETVLSAVSCSSASACTAVGSYKTDPEESSRNSFIVRWNGSTWSAQAPPSFEGIARNQLFDVACVSASECVAIGEVVVLGDESLSTTAEDSLILTWDGSEWEFEFASVPNGAPDPSITTLACADSTSCVAAGNTHTVDQPFTLTTGSMESPNPQLLAMESTPGATASGAYFPGYKKCKRNLKENTYVNSFGKDDTKKSHWYSRWYGEAFVDWCYKNKKIRWKGVHHLDAGILEKGWVDGYRKARISKFDEGCSGNKYFCFVKVQVSAECCWNPEGLRLTHSKEYRCLEFKLWAEGGIRIPNHDRNTGEGKCKPGGEFQARGSSTGPPDDWTPPSGDRFGVFRPSNSRFFLTTQLSETIPVATSISLFGMGTDIPLAGDWNADGKASIGVFRPSEQMFWTTNSIGSTPVANYSAKYGLSTDLPIVGDWDCNGTDTPGVFRPSTGVWYLSDSLSSGVTNHTVTYGTSGDIPVAGDWDGDGCDTIGVVRKSGEFANWYLSNSMSGSGATHYSIAYGLWGGRPVAGDWDDDGDDTMGIFYPSTITWHLRDTLTYGWPDHTFRYGNSQDKPLVGDWNG